MAPEGSNLEEKYTPSHHNKNGLHLSQGSKLKDQQPPVGTKEDQLHEESDGENLRAPWII